jgi:hypothetical protein
LEADGWKILELHYTTAFNLELIEKLIDIKEQPDYSEYFELKSSRDQKPVVETYPAGVKNRMRVDAKWQPFIEKVKSSNIDFSKFGWVDQVSKILGITPQKVNKWMKRYMLDFYEEHCFKRGSLTK